MTLKRVTATEAKQLVDDEGYTILDVRSAEEFAEGHPEGAYNIPFLHRGPMGMVTNQDFLRQVNGVFEKKAHKLVLSCASGGRSNRAAQQLLGEGYDVVDLIGGFKGKKDDDGALVDEGWEHHDLPTGSGAPEGRSFRDLNNQVNTAQPEAPNEAPSETEAAPAPAPSEDAEGLNRFADPSRTVTCKKLGRELPGVRRKPYNDAFGERIKNEISAAAWDMWVEHSKMLINEYRMNPIDPKSQEMLREQCEEYLFGAGGAAAPEGYIPAK